MKYNIGDKVVPVDKTCWGVLEESISWADAQNMSQDFLYVVDIDIEDNINGEIIPYCCGCTMYRDGDFFNESDLIPYVEK